MTVETSTSFIQNLKNKFAELLKRATTETKRKAYATYQSIARKITGAPNGNTIMDEASGRLSPRLHPRHIGRMIMFYYNPKWRKKLPYYDRFPLVIPIEFYDDGFLGLNLHYLPQAHRAMLMDVLFNAIYQDRYLNENNRIEISYQIVKAAEKSNLYKPCVKRYLTTHVRSKFYIIEPNDWQIALFLPTERFEKQPITVVHRDSLSKINGTTSKKKKK